MSEFADPTVKQATSATPVLRDQFMEPTCSGSNLPFGPIDDDFVRDLTDLVTRGPMIYCGRYSDVYKGVCGQELVTGQFPSSRSKLTKSHPGCDQGDQVSPLRSSPRRAKGERFSQTQSSNMLMWSIHTAHAS
jgi:hypothetical protein